MPEPDYPSLENMIPPTMFVVGHAGAVSGVQRKRRKHPAGFAPPKPKTRPRAQRRTRSR